MDPYDSHHAPGGDRSPESSTPIYDRLLAEWRSARGREGVFVPAARVEAGRRQRPRRP
ncbi:hypothetical protein ABT001_12170 [Streptomyces sp. NPDC002793]|uniref:hypothetical protein n=1 Tax=Streptomyces sp. NPDC002793 TaxID=3154432 RepID=UPI0033334FB5